MGGDSATEDHLQQNANWRQTPAAISIHADLFGPPAPQASWYWTQLRHRELVLQVLDLTILSCIRFRNLPYSCM